ncbi:MAG TPA: MFS transporter, partial [Erythrobacter sp.]|nr:MFS transporter [Erythrobacter sp.]
ERRFTVLGPYFRFIAAHPGALAFGFMLTFFSAFGQTFFIALFNREIRELYNLTAGEFGTLYAVANLTGAVLMIRAGRQIDHWPLTRFAGSVVVGLTIAATLMSVLPPEHIWVLFIALLLLRLCGQGLMYHTAVTAAARTFHGQRGQAISLVSMGFAVGEAVWPVTVVALVSAMGWRFTWAGAAVVLAVVVLPSVVGLAHRCYPPQPRGSGGPAPVPVNDRSRTQVLRDPAFYLLLPAMVSPGFVNTGVFFHQVSIAEAKGWTLMAFASAFTTYALTTLVVMLVGGRLIDRTSARAVLRFALIPLLLGLCLLAYGEAPLVAHGYMVLAGATSGLFYGISTPVWAELYGITHLGAIRAMTTGLMMVSAALAPPLLGWMIDLGFAISTMMVAAAAYVLFAIILIQPALAVHRRCSRAAETPDEN